MWVRGSPCGQGTGQGDIQVSKFEQVYFGHIPLPLDHTERHTRLKALSSLKFVGGCQPGPMVFDHKYHYNKKATDTKLVVHMTQGY